MRRSFEWDRGVYNPSKPGRAGFRTTEVLRATLLVLSASLLAAGGTPDPPGAPADPLAEDLARWQSFVASSTATDEISVDVLDSTRPLLESAARALADGRRFLALQRLVLARTNLSALAWVSGLPPAAREAAGFEAEWKRMGPAFERGSRGGISVALDGVHPAAVRAIGEAALAQALTHYEASLDYGRSTTPESGLFYLGTARAQQEIAGFCRTLGVPSRGRAPALRPVAAEIDALEQSLLRAYRPPASVDRHREFIAASATLKEARELDEAGLRHGALLRFLQAAERLAVLASGPLVEGNAAVAARLSAFETRLGPSGRDDSLARLFVEVARADLDAASATSRPVHAAAIADDVLPRYLSALEPAPSPQPRPPAKVTVTLVRWPYT